jgi:protein O-mannosyl-transferase
MKHSRKLPKPVAPLASEKSGSGQKPPYAERSPLARPKLIMAALLAATAIVYLRCLGNGFVYDDDLEIVKNRYLGQWSFFSKSLFTDSWWFQNPAIRAWGPYYRPLQNIWLGINYHLFGLDPRGWHAVMVALHLLVVWLVFKLAVELTSELWVGLLAAAMFALFPVHAEAVVWATAIPLPLSAAFELGALYLFITRAAGGGAFGRNWGLALLLYAGALLTHESAVTFPALVALYVYLLETPASGSSSPPAAPVARTYRALILACPFAAETIVYLFVRWLVLGFISRPNAFNHATSAQAAMTIPLVLGGDLLLIAMPWFAGPSHRVLLVKRVSAPEFYLPLAALLILFGGLYVLARSHPRRRLYTFCAAWMAIAIAPMMNLKGFFPQALVQDRYLFMASVGWCVIVADVLVQLARHRPPLRRLAWSGIAALLIVYGVALWNVQRFWRDDLTLFSRCVEKFPESPDWRRWLATALERRQNLAAAEEQLSAGHNFDPSDGETLYRLALVHVKLGRIAEATAEAAQALQLKSRPPAGEYIMLARLYDAQGNAAQAEEALRRAETLPEGNQAVAVARAQMKIAHGDPHGAEIIMRSFTGRYPRSLLGWTELGISLAAQKNYGEALPAFQHALQIAPNDPSSHFLMGGVLHAMGRDDEALEQCRRVLSITPDDANARALMAQIERGPVRQ